MCDGTTHHVNWFTQYLSASSTQLLNIDSGLIEALNIRLSDVSITPDAAWFDSICKYVYEKLKNEDVFLTNFYQSSAYRKLLLELEFYSNLNVDAELEPQIISSLSQTDTGSDSNSGDIPFDDEIDFVLDSSQLSMGSSSSASSTAAIALNLPSVQTVSPKHNQHSNLNHNQQPQSKCDKHLPIEKLFGTTTGTSANKQDAKLLQVVTTKHARSHSDCTGLVQNIHDIPIEPLSNVHLRRLPTGSSSDTRVGQLTGSSTNVAQPTNNDIERLIISNSCQPKMTTADLTAVTYQQRLSAKIINTAINYEGQFAVYAIHVTVIEENQQKSWHVYRRYSKFLDLKKILVKRVIIVFIASDIGLFVNLAPFVRSIHQYRKCHFQQRRHFRTHSGRCLSIVWLYWMNSWKRFAFEPMTMRICMLFLEIS